GIRFLLIEEVEGNVALGGDDDGGHSRDGWVGEVGVKIDRGRGGARRELQGIDSANECGVEEGAALERFGAETRVDGSTDRRPSGRADTGFSQAHGRLILLGKARAHRRFSRSSAIHPHIYGPEFRGLLWPACPRAGCFERPSLRQY